MAYRPLHLALANLLLLGTSGLPSIHAASRVDGGTQRDVAQPQRVLPTGASSGAAVDAEDLSSRAREEDLVPLKEQLTQHGLERSYHGMGYGGYGHGHKLDLYSSLAIFSFAIFLGYLLYNYIRVTQAGRSMFHSASDDVWSVANSLNLDAGTRLVTRVLSSLERWDDVLYTLPRDPSLVDVVGLIARKLF